VLGVVSKTWLERHKVGRRIDFSSFAMACVGLIAVFVFTILLKDQLVALMRTLTLQATG